jgi:hypothetical protein
MPALRSSSLNLPIASIAFIASGEAVFQASSAEMRASLFSESDRHQRGGIDRHHPGNPSSP